jgi:hypothetical protein
MTRRGSGVQIPYGPPSKPQVRGTFRVLAGGPSGGPGRVQAAGAITQQNGDPRPRCLRGPRGCARGRSGTGARRSTSHGWPGGWASRCATCAGWCLRGASPSSSGGTCCASIRPRSKRGSTGHAGHRRIERVKGDARRRGHERLWTPSGRDRSWHGSQHPLPADIRLPVGGRLGATRDTAHSEVVRH